MTVHTSTVGALPDSLHDEGLFFEHHGPGSDPALPRVHGQRPRPGRRPFIEAAPTIAVPAARSVARL
jgi:hypothetical protein